MSNPRQRLEHLRKRKRLEELRAKRDDSGVTPQTQPESQAANRATAAVAGAGQGLTLGFGDEIEAGLMSAFPIDRMFDWRGDKDVKFGDYKGNLELVRQRNAAQREAAPKSFLAGEVGSGVATGGVGLARTAGGRLAGSAAFGGAYGAGKAEGGIKDRLKGAALGGAIGLGSQYGLDKAGRYLAPKFQKKAQQVVPTLDELKAKAQAAYQRVDDIGARYGADDIKSLFQGVQDEIPTNGLGAVTSRTNPTTVAALKQMKKAGPKEASLSELDRLRQLTSGAAPTNPGDQRTAGIIRSNIDDFIGSMNPVSGGDDAAGAIQSARAAHATRRKAELVDGALEKGALQADSNRVPDAIFNQRKQIKSILGNPRKSAGFTPDELAAMRRVVKGSSAENAARLVGKLGSGNAVGTSIGTALGYGAAGLPGAIGLPLAAAAIRKGGDRATQKSIDDMVALIRTGSQPKRLDTAASRAVQDETIQELIARINAVGASQ